MKVSTVVIIGVILGALLALFAARGPFLKRMEIQKANEALKVQTKSDEERLIEAKKENSSERRNRAGEIVQFARPAERQNESEKDR